MYVAAAKVKKLSQTTSSAGNQKDPGADLIPPEYVSTYLIPQEYACWLLSR